MAANNHLLCGEHSHGVRTYRLSASPRDFRTYCTDPADFCRYFVLEISADIHVCKHSNTGSLLAIYIVFVSTVCSVNGTLDTGQHSASITIKLIL